MTLGYRVRPSDAPAMLLRCGGVAAGWPLIHMFASGPGYRGEVRAICNQHSWQPVVREAGYRDYLRPHEEVPSVEETYRSPESIPDWAIDLFEEGEGSPVGPVRGLESGEPEVVGVGRRVHDRDKRQGIPKPPSRRVKRDPGPVWGNAPGESGDLLNSWAQALLQPRKGKR